MTQRFSSEELYELRNRVPMDLLIKRVLRIPSKEREGYVRFLCPLCNEFDTAINPKTNMGRCFRCGKNFNTIEMVMIEKKMGFVESVRFLKKYNESRSLGNQGSELTEGGVQDRGKSVDGAQEGLGYDGKGLSPSLSYGLYIVLRAFLGAHELGIGYRPDLHSLLT